MTGKAAMPAPAARPVPEHFNWLDGLRGVAAFCIVIFHYHHFYLADSGDRPSMPPVSEFPLAGVLGPVYVHGAVAVELFWVISGFVFMHVYAGKPTSAGRFVAARIARLYPLHLLTLLVVAALQWASFSAVGHWQIYSQNDLRHFVFQLFMASHWTSFTWGLSFNGPIWSVSMEILAYALFFLCLPLLRRDRLLPPVLICAFGFAFAADLTPQPPLIHSPVFICVGFFFFGCALYALYYRLCGRTMLVVTAMTGLAAAGALAFLAGQTMLAGLCLSGAVILLTTILEQLLRRGASAARAFGDISYSLYLVHAPLQMVVLLVADLAFGGARGFADSPVTLAVYLAVSTLLAHAAYRYFERPAGRALWRVLMRSARTATNSAG